VENLKAELLVALASIDGLEHRPSPVAGGSALFYDGKEFAHFHNDGELDLRLTKKVIKALGLEHPPESINHPKRSPSSPWIEVRFKNRKELEFVVSLVQRAVMEL
jgi:hypothetical protein